MEMCFGMGRKNIVGIGENAGFQDFTLFPYVLILSQTSPGFYVSAVKLF